MNKILRVYSYYIDALYIPKYIGIFKEEDLDKAIAFAREFRTKHSSHKYIEIYIQEIPMGSLLDEEGYVIEGKNIWESFLGKDNIIVEKHLV